MKESEVTNNKNTHAYMQSEANVMFMQMQANKGINTFGERDITSIMKDFKQLYEGEMSGKPVVIPIKPYELKYEESIQAL